MNNDPNPQTNRKGESMKGLKILETTSESCCQCKGDGKDCEKGGAWIYCETRYVNDHLFNSDCGETMGCNRFVRNTK